MAGYERRVRSQLSHWETAEVERVDALAAQLVAHLHSSAEIIAALHIYGAQSKAIQDTVGELLCDRLRFRSEVVLTPQYGLVTQARPDFYFDLGVMFQGSPRATLNANCGGLSASACASLQNEARAEEARLRDELKRFKYYPVLNVGLTVGF